jgi:hypothetical protein
MCKCSLVDNVGISDLVRTKVIVSHITSQHKLKIRHVVMMRSQRAILCSLRTSSRPTQIPSTAPVRDQQLTRKYLKKAR